MPVAHKTLTNIHPRMLYIGSIFSALCRRCRDMADIERSNRPVARKTLTNARTCTHARTNVHACARDALAIILYIDRPFVSSAYGNAGVVAGANQGATVGWLISWGLGYPITPGFCGFSGSGRHGALATQPVYRGDRFDSGQGRALTVWDVEL